MTVPPTPPEDATPESMAPKAPLPNPRRVLQSEELLQGEKEVWIEHGPDMYRLRVTRNGRLYLTK